ncbi:MAG: iron hydrogenase small subunit [Coriobacteriia bacterium]|nr:iron hydrogenase small subunit [Coriobacteriia bacterium]
MARIERTIGDPKNITRREAVMGAGALIFSAFCATAIGGFAIGTYEKVMSYISKRIEVLYANDRNRAKRRSHENAECIELYHTYLSPGTMMPAKTELSHRLCHTTYGKNVKKQIEHLQSVSVEHAVEETEAQMKTLL